MLHSYPKPRCRSHCRTGSFSSVCCHRRSMNADEKVTVSLSDMISRLTSGIKMEFEVKRMDPLFASQEDYDAFQARHAQHQVKKGDLSTYSGSCYLGIDAGSTTTKVALVGEDGSLLYSFYDNNNGSTIATAIRLFPRLRKNCQRPLTLPGPAPPDTARPC